MISRTLVASALLVILHNLAVADNINGKMDFKIYDAKVYDECPSCQSHIEIQADGGIELETPNEFREFLAGKNIPPGSDVYLTSGGGTLSAGLELGRIIREHKFNTVVGAHERVSKEAIEILKKYGVVNNELADPDWKFDAPGEPGWLVSLFKHRRWPSYCASACTFVVLGGVKRFVSESGVYAVHKFNVNCDTEQMKQQKICLDPAYSMSSSQELSAESAVYLEEMGIPQVFLLDMVKSESNQLKWLSINDFSKYHICTGLLAGSTGFGEGGGGCDWSKIPAGHLNLRDMK